MTFRRIALLAISLLVVPGAQAEPSAHASPEDVEPLSVGARVPSVNVRTVSGEVVDLAARVRERGALLVFYRGGW